MMTRGGLNDGLLKTQEEMEQKKGLGELNNDNKLSGSSVYIGH